MNESEQLPRNSTPTKPPKLTGTQVAQWQGEWVQLSAAPVPPSLPIPDWSTLIAACRYQVETSGITVNTMPIATDRDSQGLITGAAVAALLDSDYSLNWKTSAGFIELSAVQILSLASAVRAHVQASFDREAQLLAAVADGSITAAMLEEGWPV
ncbi:DUF4376 domain-containing protein [Pseudomonas sp. Pseusp122]|uniref:DUF4376 domain-containing protein n=1 Tax=unclassified Pseudomonas TaxID=196821 RepID=UPI0039A6FEEB